MLKVQEYLRKNGLASLRKEKAIRVARHPSEPLVILNYDHLNSPKRDPVARECRGLVLEDGTWRVVAKSFDRFFTVGEMVDEFAWFNWSNFTTTAKEDGSLILVYHYGGRWRVNTRASFGDDKIYGAENTWSEVVWSLIPRPHRLKRAFSYVMELTSPLNKVVRNYDSAALHLLTFFATDKLIEFNDEVIDKESRAIGVSRPASYSFKSRPEVEDFILSQEERDPSFEGVVVKDDHGRRWKIKTRTYRGFAQLRNNGEYNEKLLVPFILGGNGDAILSVFPELRRRYENIAGAIEAEWKQLEETWSEFKNVCENKEFARAVMPRTPFASILFRLRGEVGVCKQTKSDLRRFWRQSDEAIVKWAKQTGLIKSPRGAVGDSPALPA